MKIGTIKESRSGENRVALSPNVCKQLVKNGFECFIESGAGANSAFLDDAYIDAGAKILPSAQAIFETIDVLCKVNPPSDEEIAQLKSGTALILLLTTLSIKIWLKKSMLAMLL